MAFLHGAYGGFSTPSDYYSDIFYNQQVRLIPHPGPGPHAQPTAATTIAFDPQQELLWTGNQYVSFALAAQTLGILIHGTSRDGSCRFTDPSSRNTRRTKAMHPNRSTKSSLQTKESFLSLPTVYTLRQGGDRHNGILRRWKQMSLSRTNLAR